MRIVAVVLLLTGATALAQPSPAPFAIPPVAEAYRPPVAWAFLAGVGTGLISLAVGGAMLASDSRSDKIAGSYLFMTGLSLAPAVSHLTCREWGRAAIFGSLPTAALLGMVGLLETHPAVVDEGNKDSTRVVYAVLAIFAVASSAGGLVDSLWAGERARQKSEKQLTLAPVVSRDQWGLALGGAW